MKALGSVSSTERGSWEPGEDQREREKDSNRMKEKSGGEELGEQDSAHLRNGTH